MDLTPCASISVSASASASTSAATCVCTALMLRMSLNEPDRGLARNNGCDNAEREGAAPVLAASGGEEGADADAGGSARFEA